MRGQAPFLSIALLLIAVGCGRTGGAEYPVAADSSRFRNLSAEFIGDEACFDCHEDQYRGFQEHGMANSMYPLRTAAIVEDFSGIVVHDPRRDLYYRPYREGDGFYVEEFRRGPGGEEIHSLVRELEYVVGSGTAARTYLVEENGHYFEIPVTWYTQEEQWDLSPGYEVRNMRFDRRIPSQCMTCHNSYPVPVPFVEGKYEQIPSGIGCERCHGPGSIHVEARLASPEPAGEIDVTIVNPAHLPFDRRLDVCQQCHLHTTVSVLREGRTSYDYRPSQPLSEHVAFYVSEAPSSDEEEIDVISHADLMKRSACFTGTQAWEKPMDCMTCHDPHEGFRSLGPAYFNSTCMGCHEVEALRSTLPEGPALLTHTTSADCIACHMPKAAVKGTPHTSLTDHHVRVVEEGGQASGSAVDAVEGVATWAPTTAFDPAPTAVDAPTPTPASASAPGGLRPYFPEDGEADVYAGMAYVIHGKQRSDSTMLRQGVELLRETAGSFGEAQYLLGFAHLQLGEVAEAIGPLERAVSLEPNPERLNTLAQAYEQAGREERAIRFLYEQALDLQPALAYVRVNYGRYLEMIGRVDDAIEHYRVAIREHPWLAPAHFNLGTAWLRKGEIAAGEASLREAIRLDPDYALALVNLGLVLASNDRVEEARQHLERAVHAEPDNPLALGNLGAFHLNAERHPDRAIPLLSRAVEVDPGYVDGWANLALAFFLENRDALARSHAEQALRLAPNHGLARRVLDAL